MGKVPRTRHTPKPDSHQSVSGVTESAEPTASSLLASPHMPTPQREQQPKYTANSCRQSPQIRDGQGTGLLNVCHSWQPALLYTVTMKIQILITSTLCLYLGCNEPPKTATIEDTPSETEDDAGAMGEDLTMTPQGPPMAMRVMTPVATNRTMSHHQMTVGGHLVLRWNLRSATDNFSWESVGRTYTCRLSGASGIVHVYPDDFDSCEFPPWWVEIFEDEHPSFVQFSWGAIGDVAHRSNDGARIFNLEETLKPRHGNSPMMPAMKVLSACVLHPMDPSSTESTSHSMSPQTFCPTAASLPKSYKAPKRSIG